MRHLFAIVAVVVLVVGVWRAFDLDVPGTKDACATSYVDGVWWEDELYVAATEIPEGRRLGRRLGTGRRPGDCGGRRTTVYTVRGIPLHARSTGRGRSGRAPAATARRSSPA